MSHNLANTNPANSIPKTLNQLILTYILSEYSINSNKFLATLHSNKHRNDILAAIDVERGLSNDQLKKQKTIDIVTQNISPFASSMKN